MGKKDPHITIRLTKAQLDHFIGFYAYWIQNYNPESEHEKLLYCHLCSMFRYMERIIEKSQKQYTISLNEEEALAFMQTWATDDDLSTNVYDKVILYKIIECIDKTSKQPKTLL